jgi:hypothetical protein
LAEGLAYSESIKRLSLNQMVLSYEGLDKLAEAVRINTVIERIDLSCNDMDDSYGSIVAKFISS